MNAEDIFTVIITSLAMIFTANFIVRDMEKDVNKLWGLCSVVVGIVLVVMSVTGYSFFTFK